MPKDTWSNLFILAPAKIEISFAHWGDKQIVELDFSEYSGSNSIQIISGLNGSGKTITLEAVKRYTEVFTDRQAKALDHLSTSQQSRP